MLPTPALALRGSPVAEEFTGSGTEADPYCIESLSDLELLRDKANAGEVGAGEWFRLYADINMSLRYGPGRGEDGADQSWTPIGTSDHPFSGIFDGNGHTVTGLYIHVEQGSQALFGRIDKSGTVKNISVEGSVTSVNGILIHDYTAGVAAINYGTVENCHSDVSVSGRSYAGGVVGSNRGTIRNCSNRGAVTGANYTNYNYYVGGIVGENLDGSVENCYNTGSVSGTKAVGGVVGRNYSNGKVKNCFNTGAITGTKNCVGVGGIVGDNENGGTGEHVSVENCFNTGTVTGGEGGRYIGGAIGYNYGSATNCYYLDTCGAGGAKGVSKTAEEFKTLAALLGDAFQDVAFLGHPILKSNFQGFLLSDLADLERFRDFVNAGNFAEGETVFLTADIDMSGSYGAGKDSWTPIGTDDHPFIGTFDGGGHQITGLYLYNDTDRISSKGLFGTVGQDDQESTVQNLGVSGSVTASTSLNGGVGGVMGRLMKGTVQFCHYSGSITSRGGNTGGLVGSIGNGFVMCCYNTGDITGPEGSMGGVVGYIDSGSPISCYNTGTITTTGVDDGVGPVVGGDLYSRAENCYYLDTCGATGAGESKTADEFASGEVAYLLQSDWGDSLVWGQTLTGDDQDVFPVLTDDFSKAVCLVTFQNGDETVLKTYCNLDGTVSLPTTNPVKEGYAFAGWYTQTGTGGDQFTADTAVQEDITLYAQWKHSVPAAPAIDYEKETLATTTAMEYSTDGTNWTACTADMPVSDLGWNGSEKTVQFRTAATTGYHASDAVDLIIPARPGAPTGPAAVNETFAGENDGKLTGVSAAMEYKLSTAETWTACGGTEVTGLVPGVYQVRTKAVTAAGLEAFASAEAAVTIEKGAEKTYTLSVDAPAFEAVTYGDPQPGAQAIVITNEGNSDATISGVALSGDGASAFILNTTGGATVAAGGTDSATYTVQPAANLDQGTYTATITVTYDGGDAAAADVSFTVNGAAQEAPTAPEEDHKTCNSVTLKEIAANANGAKAQYSRDGTTWQDSPEFTGLSANTEYSFMARYAAIGNYEASPASGEVKITTDAAQQPSFPPVSDEPKPCPQDEACPISAFTDSDPTAWYHDGVHYCLEKDLMSGFGNGKFGPNGKLTRAQLTQILYNKEGRPSVSPDSGFVDVAKDMWYAKAIFLGCSK